MAKTKEKELKDMTKAELKNELSWYRMHESIDKMMAHKFLDSSQKRGKALEILLPKVNKDDVAELLAELYDLRRYKEKEEANKKAKEYLSTEEVIDKLTEKCKERKAKKKKAKK